MVLVRDESSLKLLISNGTLCNTCCNVGHPCTHCTPTVTPATLTLTLSGIVDCSHCYPQFPSGSIEFANIAANTLWNTEHVLAQLGSGGNACWWTKLWTPASAYTKVWGNADCTGVPGVQRTIHQVGIVVQRQNDRLDVEFQVQDTNTDWTAEGIVDGFQVLCDSGECTRCTGGLTNKQGCGPPFQLYDFTNVEVTIA